MRGQAFLFAACLAAACSVSAAPVGSYTVNYKDGIERAPEGAKLLLTGSVKEDDGTEHDVLRVEIDISGLTEAQAGTLMLNVVRPRGSADANGPNSIKVRFLDFRPLGGERESLPISKVDGSSSSTDVTLSLDGTVKKENIKPGEAWQLDLEIILPDYDEGAFELCPAGACYFAHLPVGRTSEQAALILFDSLALAGFPDVAVNGSTVSFLRSPSGEIIDDIQRFAYTGANVHIGLSLPTEVPEPSTATVVLLGLVTLFVQNRRFRTRPRPAPVRGVDKT